ncbi:hypothetical protein ILUMI_13147 [Ignelater luminosus]|uniref:Serpin domain-containing protein n=1 Tax=Ignelater luminosus TaxID=2038154 RepID=A0A8K0GC94_IGNLU|nr:hypothetical protein ILUMI_13147 [Ignelater luminosus]
MLAKYTRIASRMYKIHVLLILHFSYSILINAESDLDTDCVEFSSKMFKFASAFETHNVIVSPPALRIILALLAYAGDTNTTAQIFSSSHFPNHTEYLEDFIGHIESLYSLGESAQLINMNKMYFKKGFKIDSELKKVLQKSKTSYDIINFMNIKSTVSYINSWIRQGTRNKIKKMLDVEDFIHFYTDAAFVIVNVLYFHARWRKAFDSKRTSKRAFYWNFLNIFDIEMMETRMVTYYLESSELDAKFLKLPFEQDDLSMYLILPNDEESDIRQLEEQIEKVLLQKLKQTYYVHVVIPKFKFVNMGIDLKDVFKEFGISDVFDRQDSFAWLGSPPIKLNQVFQQTLIEMNEEGKTPAGTKDSESGLNLSKVTFIANHPFLFYVRHKNSILFLGRFSPEDK